MGDYAQFAQTCPDSASGIVNACGPGSPDSHRVVWGLTSRPPVPPAGFPPVSRLPAGFSPFARLPQVSRRPAFSGLSPSAAARFRFPFGVPPGSLPLSNLHDSAAARRFRRRWSRAARAKVTSPAATPRLDLAVIRPALQMGSGWAQWDAATESPVTSGRERRTPPRPNRRPDSDSSYGGYRGGCQWRIVVGWRPGRRMRPLRPAACRPPGGPPVCRGLAARQGRRWCRRRGSRARDVSGPGRVAAARRARGGCPA